MIGLIIPTRDRPLFLAQAIHLISLQTRQPDKILIHDEKTGHDIDLNYKYRTGLKQLFDEGCDCVVLWEDDDYYKPEYIETMYNEWLKNKPTLLGIDYSIYYHLKSKKYARINHPGRASAMSMMIGKDILNIEPPYDWDKDFDLHICDKVINKAFISPVIPLNLGIKHGIGTCGGKGHNEGLTVYKHAYNDSEFIFLKNMTKNQFNFYNEIRSKL